MLKRKSTNRKRMLVAVLTVALAVVVAGAAFAFTDPGASAGTGVVGWDLYDLVVNKFIKGPIGSAAGVSLVVVGAVGAAMGKLTGAVWPLIGGGVLVGAPSMAISLGMLF